MSNGKVAKRDCADLTPPLHKRSQAVHCCVGVCNAVLTPPVEKESQLTLSAQWLLEEPLDGELEAPKTPSPRSWFKCRSNEAMAATK